MRIGIIGCGYVVDDYLRSFPNHPELVLVGVADRDQSRADKIAALYGTKAYKSAELLLQDNSIDTVVNLTNPQSHYEISKAALLSGKNVYSEKPLALQLNHAQELVELAYSQRRVLSGAPCNVLSESWRSVRNLLALGAIGRPVAVYAELDDNPIHLMKPEEWRSSSGTPWPYANEFEMGCTLEHAGYHLTGLVAHFGTVAEVTASSACVIPEKTSVPSNPPAAADLSVASLVFSSGEVARLTCSIVAPYDHRLRVIGEVGMITLDDCWRNQSSVHVEQFSQLSLNARKLRSVRHSPRLQAMSGVGGRRQRLLASQNVTQARQGGRPSSSSLASAAMGQLRRRQLISMDLLLGLQDMQDALAERRDPLISPELLLHVTELTLAIAGAGPTGVTYRPVTSFVPTDIVTTRSGVSPSSRPNFIARATEKLIVKLHQRGSRDTRTPSL